MRTRVLCGVLSLFFIVHASSRAQESDSVSNSLPYEPPPGEINTGRLAIVGGSVLTTMAVIHIYQSNGWWNNNRQSFHFQEDLDYALNVDKLGHFFGASAMTFVLSKSLRWANFSETGALCWGAGVSTLFQTYVEVEDGFSTWGFDRVDFAADVAGAWYPVIQYAVPPLRNLNLKFSYLPSENINAPGAFPGQKHLLMDDYEGQTFWFSVNVNNVLPNSIEPYWPDFLCLALGYGARDILTTNPYRVYFLSLDYDMTKIIPQDSDFLRMLGEALNYVHFPAPAVRISPDAIWYGLYF